MRIPAVVLEIVGGIIVSPSGFGWVRVDLPVQILALFCLAFLLFLAGLEIDVVPVFFVGSEIRLDLTGLLHSPSALARVPLFLLACWPCAACAPTAPGRPWPSGCCRRPRCRSS